MLRAMLYVTEQTLNCIITAFVNIRLYLRFYKRENAKKSGANK